MTPQPDELESVEDAASANRAAPVPAPVRTDAARHRRVELLATFLLAMAAVATAWSTYQSTRWRGEQAAETGRSTAQHIESAQASTRAGQLTEIDVATFTQWVDAYATGDVELADFYRERFRDEFQPAFDAWIATNPRTNPDAPPTPFAMPEYQLSDDARAEQIAAAAVASSREAARALQRSDNYMLAVVLFATSLFFAGICSKFDSMRGREVLLGLGALIFVSAAVWVVVLTALDWT